MKICHLTACDHIFDTKTASYDFGVIDLNTSEDAIKLKVGRTEITKIFGNVSEYFILKRFPIYTTMILPDGSEKNLKTSQETQSN
ncbi:MAG: hypothetical protein OEL56_00300 [Nitrosopumilus sp.]|nr:hypothetical protein [Nitrosopumilus sp.]MDH3515452.1 hypothetical protein [Nitrosopumilus sp.]MDH3564248.1 hypothetical protein [Nitrosopumilus sp.]MDH5416594.1 hypothetical protein [Nitrosopumilus sp.]MDH5555139.1 hypothetical protein [Nitrosopumilus sp.]